MSRPWQWVSIRLAYGVRAGARVAAQAPGSERQPAALAGVDRLGGQAHRAGVAVVEANGSCGWTTTRS